MIIGLGADITGHERLKRTLDRQGGRFSEMVFSEREWMISARRQKPIGLLAAIFAAKEAFAKATALGLFGIGKLADLELDYFDNRLRFNIPESLRLRLNMPVFRTWVDIAIGEDFSSAIVILEGVAFNRACLTGNWDVYDSLR